MPDTKPQGLARRVAPAPRSALYPTDSPEEARRKARAAEGEIAKAAAAPRGVTTAGADKPKAAKAEGAKGAGPGKPAS